jgi:hypothetical protein
MSLPTQQHPSTFRTATSETRYSSSGRFKSAATTSEASTTDLWLGEVRVAFNRMYGQPDGWGGPGSLAIPAPLADIATTLLEIFARTGADRPSLSQDPDGGLSIEWLTSPTRAELTISNDGVEYWIKNEDGRYVESTVSSASDLLPLVRLLSK